jgi:hypothetical protein
MKNCINYPTIIGTTTVYKSFIIIYPNSKSAYYSIYIKSNAGVINTPIKLARVELINADASSPPDAFVKTTIVLIVIGKLEQIKIPSAKSGYSKLYFFNKFYTPKTIKGYIPKLINYILKLNAIYLKAF